jgi:hypothetical protein
MQEETMQQTKVCPFSRYSPFFNLPHIGNRVGEVTTAVHPYFSSALLFFHFPSFLQIPFRFLEDVQF